MHVWGGFFQKVHYNALFGAGKRQEKALSRSFGSRDAEYAEKRFEEDQRRETPSTATPPARLKVTHTKSIFR
jgi:hypothetical protein